MAKVVSPILATVEFVTAVKEGQYGPYRSVLFKDAAGEKIWKSFDLNAEELALLRKGAQVQLIPAGERNGKTTHNVVLLDAPAIERNALRLELRSKAPAQTAQNETFDSGWTLEQKRAIANQVQQHADLLRYCLETAKSKFGDLVDPRDMRALATTLFLQVLR